MKKALIVLLSVVFVLSLFAGCMTDEQILQRAEELKAEETKAEETITFAEFQWPDSEIASLLPRPESNIGSISWEASYGFVIYVGETTIEQYDAYVNECKQRGFTVDYQKGDDFFYADNEAG